MFLRVFFLLCLASIYTAQLSGQCPVGNVNLASQAQLDSFILLYPNCTELPGNLKIEPSFQSIPDITDLSGLSNLTSISGGLIISRNDALATLAGLQNLTSIEGILSIYSNPLLVNLNPLGTISSVSGLYIEANSSLSSIEALSNIAPQNLQSLTISDNPLLSECAVDFVCNYLSDLSHSATIENNGPNCENIGEVANICPNISTCPIGEVRIATQAELDIYTSTYPNCLRIRDHLYLGDQETPSDIHDLSGLSSLRLVDGCIYIRNNPDLLQLDGFDNLERIERSLFIEGNDNLQSIEALERITYIGNGLEINNNSALISLEGLNQIKYLRYGLSISENSSLTSLSGLDSLILVQNSVYIHNNQSLTSLQGLNALSVVHWDLLIHGNPSLTSLEGLDNLYWVWESISLRDNPVLESMHGLDSLRWISFSMSIHNNNALTSLESLSHIEQVHGYIRITNNDNLSSLKGLHNINPSLIMGLEFTDNPQLTICDLGNICSFLEYNSSDATIAGNATGCQSRDTVKMQCNTIAPGGRCDAAINVNQLFRRGEEIPQTSMIVDNSDIAAVDVPPNGNICHRDEDPLTGGVWFRFVGDGNTYSITTTACDATNYITGGDTQMTLYQGDCNTPQFVDCTDDLDFDQGLLNAELTIETEQSMPYLLLVDGYGNHTGEYCLEVTQLQSEEEEEEEMADTALSVYPNPTNGLAKLENITAYKVIIYNLQGLEVSQFNTPGNELDISTLPTGVFILQLHTLEEIHILRITKS